MSLSPFDWSSHITRVKETSSIPPDVVFQIVENDQLCEVSAHKWVLALISPVFEKMFFTTEVGDKTAQHIKVEQTTKSAFQILIDAAYNSESIEDSLNGKSVPEVFDVVYLIERYEIEELREVIMSYLSDYPVTDDTMLEVASEAMQYARLFPREAQQLLLTCAKFLQPKVQNVRSVYKYAVGLENDKKDVFATLLAKMDGIPFECSNCKNVKCKNGEGVKDDEFRLGLVVSNNMHAQYYICNYWDDTDYGIGVITEIEGYQVKVKTIKPGVNKDKFGDLSLKHKKAYCEVPLFLYSCY